MKAIFSKEMKAYFHGLSGYFFLAAFVFFLSVYFIRDAFYLGNIGSNALFSSVSVILVLLLPVITMRSFAAEQQNGTDILLLTGPASPLAIVLGKFFASGCVFFIGLILSGLSPLILFFSGRFYVGDILLSYLGFGLLGLSIIAIGLFFSSLSSHPLRAGLVTIGALLILWMFDNVLPNLTDSSLYGVLSSVSVFGRLENFQYGLLSFSSILFFLSLTILFLFLTAKSLDQRRWSRS